MGNWLNPDNQFLTFMGKVFDVLLLNTIWLLICVPLPMLTIVLVAKTEIFLLLILTLLTILPIIPATTALYYALVKSVRKERSYVIKEFFRSFIRNIKQGSILTLIALVIAVILYVDFQYAWGLIEAQSSAGSLYFCIFIIITLFVGSMYVYVCPILSRFDMKVVGLLKIAFVMGVRHLLTTIALFLLLAVVLLGCYVFPPGMFFLPAVGALVASFMIERVFVHYMPKKEEVQVDEFGDEIGQGKDEWYLD